MAATYVERDRQLPGDGIVADPDVVMDRGFDLPVPPEVVWPWLVQLGKRRAGWYFPRPVEWFVPPRRRGIRHLDQRWQELAVGDVIPDYGGTDATFTLEQIEPPSLIVYSSIRGNAGVSWVLHLEERGGSTRVHLRLRIGPVKHPRLVGTAGGLFDLLTIAGLAGGLRERLTDVTRGGLAR